MFFYIFAFMEEKTVNQILSVFLARSGFDDWWFTIDEETQKEIIDELNAALNTDVFLSDIEIIFPKDIKLTH